MAEITKAISVDVAQINVFQAIVAKQNDSKSRYLEVTLTNEGVPLAITPTSTVTINALREDGKSKSFSGTVNNSGTVVVPLTNWMLELDGNVKCDITVFDTENRKLTTTLFTIAVEESANSGTEISEDANYDLLTQLLTDCTNAKNDCEAAAEQANAAVDNLSGTLAGELEKYVKFTDYASYSKAGVAKVDPVGSKGISIDGNNFLTMVVASPSDITGRIGNRAITPLNLNAAVKAALTDGSKISNMTETEKNNARDTIGAEKMTTIAVKTTSDVFLSDKVDTRVSSSVTTINLILPTPVVLRYESAFSFQSGTTATTLAYPGDAIKFVGVDCDEIGDFIPTSNKNYEVIIKNLSTNMATPLFVARVGVY